MRIQRQTNSKSYMIYRSALYSMTLNYPNQHFKVTPTFDAEHAVNGTR